MIEAQRSRAASADRPSAPDWRGLRLGTLATGRDNNLNLIRMLAAIGVLISHAVPISQGPEFVEPLKELTGYSLGTLCVMVFFVISGFLITASYERTSSRRSFLLARGLRLIPGLLINLLFVAFVLGVVMTRLPVAQYLSGSEPYAFVLRNMALVPLVYELPGVLDDAPYTAIVGSIWTLRHEVFCYAAVFLAGLLGIWQRQLWSVLALAAYGMLWLAITVADPAMPTLARQFVGLSMPFAIGVAFYVWREALPLHWLGVALTATLAWITAQSLFYPITLSLAIGYGTFCLAYLPRQRWLLGYNRLGDYSYGTYLYAFPLQGAAVWAFGMQTPLENILYSLPPTLLLSVLSWHLVEGPAMAAKGRILRRITPKVA